MNYPFLSYLFCHCSIAFSIFYLVKYLANYYSDFSDDGNAINRFNRRNDLYNEIDIASRAQAAIELTNIRIIEQYYREQGIDISEHSAEDLFSPKVDLDSPTHKFHNPDYKIN